jgi:ribosome-associated translation inhibitor RaiA
MNTQPVSIEHRVTELEKNEAVNDAERRHINTRLESLDSKVEAIGVEFKVEMKAIGAKVDEGFEKVYASFRTPIMVVAGGLLLAVVAWIVNGGLAT